MKRIHYIPGLISLALLFPLGLWYLHSQRAFKQERCVTLTFPPPPETTNPLDFIVWWPDPKDTIPDFECLGQLDADLPALRAFHDRLQQLKSHDDRQTKVHVHFGPEATYASVMHAIESCRLTTRAYGLFGSDLWTYYTPPANNAGRPVQPISTIEPLLCGGTISTPPTFASRWKDRIMELVGPGLSAGKTVWPSIPIFIALLIISFNRVFAATRMKR